MAPAKLNLTLRVLGRRPDGYHEVATLMAPIDVFDVVRVRLGAEPSCDCAGVEGENLALRAAEMTGARVAIRIDKRIPVAAGLAGGSSDAACVLRLLSAADRLDLAARLGADVPFFLHGGAAWATGIGTDLEAVPDLPAFHVVVVVPPVQLSTATMYRALGRGPFAGAPPSRPPLHGSLDRLCEQVANDFLPAAIARVPEVARTRRALLAVGARATSVSGKGPACFGLFATHEDAVAASTRLRSDLPQDFWVVAARPLPPRHRSGAGPPGPADA